SGEAVLRRGGEQRPVRERGLHLREVALGRLWVRRQQRLWRLTEGELRGRPVGLRHQQRDHEHGARERNDDDRYQPAAALEGVEIAPNLDWIVRRKLGRGVSSNAVV